MRPRPSLRIPESSNDTYCSLASSTLLRQTKELEKQFDGARKNANIEYVHKLRVASRRLRSSLSVFAECFEPKLTKKWRKRTRDLTRSIGAARDADVQIAFLQNYSKTLQDEAAIPGLEYILTSKRSNRKEMQSDVIGVLEDLEDSRILDEISDSCKAISTSKSDPSVVTLMTFQKAHDKIAGKLDELLAFEPFVHDEAAAAKHHEMRIAAKRLRYTMEIFSPIYKAGLRDQISLLKQFQDVLGDMHDYFVWSQELRADRPDIPTAARYGVTKLLTDLTEMRRTRYRNFVFLWDDTVANGLFDRIRQLTDVGPRSAILQELLKRDERVAVISDIHGNLDALCAVVSDAQKSGLHVFLNAGDAVGFGIYPSQVVQTLRSGTFLNVIGNVDLEILETLHNPSSKGDEAGKELAIEELTPSDVAYLESLPKELRLQIDGRTILVTHGTPDSVDEHLYPDSPVERFREIALKTSADVIITGHTHTPMNRNVDGVSFINPGSVGRPVDGDPRAEYAVLSLESFSVEFRRVNYDFETVANEMRRKGMAENLAQVIVRAVPSSIIKKQEEELKRKEAWKNRSTITQVRDVARKYLSDETHPEQDRKLALMIYDKTKNLHSLGREEKYWLECAALLHDIGLSGSGKAHHKSSLNLILNETNLPFTHKERYLIGSIARYHRKALPDKKHFNLKPLSQAERGKIAILSSILRVADALDYSHKSVVSTVSVKAFPNHIALECRFSGNHDLEDMSVSKKKDLFEETFKSALTIVWKSNPSTRSTLRDQESKC